MKYQIKTIVKVLLPLLIVLFASNTVHAYLGPGAGLGMIGSLIAIVVVGLVIVLGLVVYPIRMMRKRRAEAQAENNKENSTE